MTALANGHDPALFVDKLLSQLIRITTASAARPRSPGRTAASYLAPARLPEGRLDLAVSSSR